MVNIGDMPIILHIMKSYANYGINDFIVASGYKTEVIEKFFSSNKFSFSVTVVNTGLSATTGERVKIILNSLNDNQFFLTYGDGLSNINFNKLLKFHNQHGKLATVSAVRPPARFGGLDLNGEFVEKFTEKDSLSEAWINGGFFVINKDVIKYIINNDFFENEALPNLARNKELLAYKHTGFWKPMDTLRDKTELENIYYNGSPPWLSKTS